MCKLLLLSALLLLVLSMTSRAGQPVSDSAGLKAIFASPPREYSSAPLWVWNDDLTEDMVRSTLRDLAAQDVKQAFVHPRPGLMTPYLSADWFRLWKAALDEARQLDMNLWIYDENSYPSGFAGGFVPDAMPESRGRGLGMREEKKVPKWADDFIAVFQQNGEECADVSARVKAAENLPDGTYLVFVLLRAGDSPWTGGRCYVDLMYPGVTEKFIEVTLDAYKRELGDQFGKRIPGTFTDEPHTIPSGGLPWTEHLPAEFQKRWGYSLLEHLPSLWRKVGDWKRVRHNYYQVVLEQFIEHWAKPMHDWCEKNQLEFTGHYWEHEWPRARFGPDNMAMYAWHQRPAIDILMNQYSEDVHAQFGNVRAVKELTSVANQLGLPRTLCEAYGAAGWDSRCEDYKRIGDWLYVLGVNTLDQHLSYVSLRGARKRDHPQSFSYHDPWWPAYHTQGLYFARLSAALSAGEEVNRVLVIEPTTTAWMYNAEGADDPQLKKIGEEFQKLVTELSKQQVEYDIASEDIIARHGSVDDQALRVGRRVYNVLIVPPLTENLNKRTLELLRGLDPLVACPVLCLATPTVVDGQPAQELRDLQLRAVSPEELRRALEARGVFKHGPRIEAEPGQKAFVLHQRRQLDDGDLLFVTNTSLDLSFAGTVKLGGGSVEELNPSTGETRAHPFAPEFGVYAPLKIPIKLAPGGSLLLFVSREKRPPVAPVNENVTTVQPVGEMTTRRIAPNVLTLDYVDVTAGGETKKDSYFYQAGQFVWQKNGVERNPWDSAVQFKDELITKKFPEGSGFEATYRFTIEDRVPADLAIVIERPDLYTITCNGQPVSAKPGEWWLDKQFGKLDIAKTAKVGRNEVTIKASPMTMFHELESAYVLGDFALRATDKGFVIVPPGPLKLGKWNEQGHPFYADRVAYVERFDVPGAPTSGRLSDGTDPARYIVALPAWYGSVAEVLVGGKSAGYIFCQPYELDVTDRLTPGPNTIEVVVIGTLKNTLGPHHGNPPLGTAWPSMWHKAPNPGPPAGKDYSTVGYGLFEPFVLKQSAP